MGRPREFLEEEALESGMQLFWTGGFHATSTREIEEVLGLGRQSVYNAFGDKEELYHLCLIRYRELILNRRREEIFKADAGRREIVKYLAAIVEFLDRDPQRRGCFLFNALAELSVTDAFVLEETQRYQKETETCLLSAIQNGLRTGEINNCADPSAVAVSITATEMGMSLSARAQLDRRALVDMASTVLQPLY